VTCHESYLLKIYNPEWRGAEDDEGIDLYLDSGEAGGLEDWRRWRLMEVR